MQLTQTEILKTQVTTSGEEEILEYILDIVEKQGKKLFVTTPNPEILVYAARHREYQKVLNSAEISLPDGVGIIISGKFLGKLVKNRITGVDFMKKICEMVEKKPITIGFLGGGPNIAKKASECLKKEFSELKISFAEAKDPTLETAKFVKKHPVDILFVAYGFPKQEQWISQHLEHLPVTVVMAVGGSLDYLSGAVPRAPKWLRLIGFEWVFRLFVQPWRWRRQLALIEFMWLVLIEKLRMIRVK